MSNVMVSCVNPLDKQLFLCGRHDIVMLGRRIPSGSNGLDVLREGRLQWGCMVRQCGHKAWTVRGQPQGILSHNDTAVTGWPSSATDYRNVSLFYHVVCNLRRHRFEQDRGRSRTLHEQ